MLIAIKTFLTSEEGPTAVEYAVMLALIIIVCISAIQTFGLKVNDLFGTSNIELNNHGIN